MSNLFVTVGSTSFPALTDFVIEPDTQAELHSLGIQHVTVQYGAQEPQRRESSLQNHSKLTQFAYASNLQSHVEAASLIVSHAGAGTILEVTDMGKPLIVVVNSDLMSDHQTELADAMSRRHCCRVIQHHRITEDLIPAVRAALLSPSTKPDPPRRITSIFSAIVCDELAIACQTHYSGQHQP